MTEDRERQYVELLKAGSERRLRTAATLIGVPVALCHVRKCRRDNGCSGPILECVSKDGERVPLPGCIASGGGELFEQFIRELQDISRHPESRLPRFERRLKGRIW